MTRLHVSQTAAVACVTCMRCVVSLQSYGYGPPELVTCGRDGCVRVWDVRQHDAPVAAFEPADSNNVR
jgi:WD40 repeat protein